MKIGLLYPRTGPAGVWAPAFKAAAVLAAAEINTQGGVLGRDVELYAADCGDSRAAAVAALDDLLALHRVDAVVGGHASNLRDAVSARLAGRAPYVYTAQYEGVACGPSTVAIGSIDPELLRPALAWLKEHKRADRFVFVGDDYIWPRMARQAALACVLRQGGRWLGEIFLPERGGGQEEAVARIARSGADVVVCALLGQNAVDFNRAFARAGLDSRMLRFGLIVDETIVCGIGADYTGNLFTAAHYFAGRRSGANGAFLERYHDAFGEWAPPASAQSVLFHQGVHFVAAMARERGTAQPRALARWLDRPMSPRAARALVGAKPLDRSPPVLLAAADGLSLDVIAEFAA